MPTADAYWRAAADFAELAEETSAEAAPLTAGVTDGVVVGGRLRATLDDAVAAIISGLGTTADGWRALAAECRRRAIACEEYTEALRAHERSLATQAPAAACRSGPVPMPVIPPPPREPWMTAG